MKSCYVQRPCGKWDKTPEHPAESDSFRCLIGFVTAGYVRGSAKPVNEAFYAAYLLAELGGKQWEGMQEKQKKEHEIFVLVRNPRYVAYMFALTTIILEQKAEDVEFM